MTIAFITAVIAIISAIAVAVVEQLRKNREGFARLVGHQKNAPEHRQMTDEEIRGRVFGTVIFTKVFGLTIAVGKWFGNCFAPAIVLEWSGVKESFISRGKTCYPTWAKLTIRTLNHIETDIHWRGWLRFDWNSGHVAKRFGVSHDTDFGGYEQYSGVLGNHMNMN